MYQDLKILPEYFEEVLEGRKTFEIRKNDRNYKVGDVLNLREWDMGYSGRSIEKEVVYIYYGDGTYGLPEGWCVMAIR